MSDKGDARETLATEGGPPGAIEPRKAASLPMLGTEENGKDVRAVGRGPLASAWLPVLTPFPLPLGSVVLWGCLVPHTASTSSSVGGPGGTGPKVVSGGAGPPSAGPIPSTLFVADSRILDECVTLTVRTKPWHQ